jgi:small subunit ribosomal protein S16
MLMMRLQRVGRKNDPSYRIVVTDKRTSPKSNKHVDLLGSFNPKAGVATIDAEKAKYWLAQGVQPSVTLHNMLVSQKIVEGKKINALSRKSPIIDEEALKKAAEEKAAAEAAAAAALAAASAPAEEVPAPEAAPETAEEPKEEAAA